MSSRTKEAAIVVDNGNRNGYAVNFALVNSKEYHDRFDNLTKRKRVNESLYKNATRILERRSGTEYEDLVILDARTGELLIENISATGMAALRCGLSQTQMDSLNVLGRKFVALHNHPNSSFPSLADISVMFFRNLQVGSVVACHNGTVYYLEKIKYLPIEEVKEMISEVRKAMVAKFFGLPDNLIEKRVAQAVVLKLEQINILRFKEVC